VCLENFAQAAELLPDARKIAPLPGAGLLSDLQRSWPAGLQRLESWMGDLYDEFAPDLVVNLTPSLTGRLLTRRMTASGVEARGFLVDGYGFNADSSPWAAFLQLAAAERGASPFNIVDLFVRVAGLPHSGRGVSAAIPEGPTSRSMEASLSRATPPGAKGLIALQLGASSDLRRWPVAKFRELASRLWKKEALAPMLLGSAAEKPLALRFKEKNQTPVIDLVGKTSLSELAAALSSASVCVTNDTGTMHLAAALGLPVAAIFLATAQPFDTGPARLGCLCLEPDLECHPCPFGQPCPHNEACRQAVDAKTVAGLVRRRLREGRWPQSDPAGPRVWETVLDEENWRFLKSLSGHDQTDRMRWIKIQRRLFRRFLDGEPPGALDGLSSLSPALQASLSRTAADALAIGELLSQQCALLARDPRPALKSKFLKFCQQFQQILESCPPLTSLAGLWRFELQNYAMSLSGLLAVIQRYMSLLRSLQALSISDRHAS
jgi:ADP-heptose:LPS heptosyltransferase